MKKILLVAVFILGVLSIGLQDQYFSWDDDPNQDHIPFEMLNNLSDHVNGPSDVITDDDGYDNIFLGTDFAEPHISMNPRNPLQSFTAFNTNGTHATIDGYNWFTNNPNFGVPISGDPVTAYDSLGNLYYDNMRNSGGNIIGTQVAKSTNNGQTWVGTVTGNTGNDKNWIAADQSTGPYANNVYGTMTPGNIMRSTNQGASFSIVASVSNNLPGMMTAVGPDGATSGGSVYVVTNTGGSFTPVYTFYRSTNGGSSFGFQSSQQFVNYVGTVVGGRHSVQNMRTRPYPFITADNSFGPNRGRLYLVYAKNDPDIDGAKPSIYCRYSNDFGTNWSSPVRVNDDGNYMSNNHFMPATWCDKETGRLYVKWMDTRDCPTSDSSLIYASYSTDGGATFVQNQKISGQKFKIDCSTCGGGGTPRYQGDYDAITSNAITSLMVWTDFRNGTFGSYVAYYPDFAMKTNITEANINNGQSVNIQVSVPSVKQYGNSVKFTASLDSTPVSGSINLSFQGGIDSLTSYPGNVTLVATASGSVTPGLYPVRISGRGPNGTPVHQRVVDLLVNASRVVVQTNRGSAVTYTVNGTPYNTTSSHVFANGSNVTISAPPSVTSGSTRYVFDNWSNSGDTTQVLNVSQNIELTANYKIAFQLLVNSSQGHTFGGGQFYDSASTFVFGVTDKKVINGNDTFYYRGFTGLGVGAYTSPDSNGTDDSISWNISNAVVELARWTLDPPPIGIQQISSEIPDKFDLFQNYPNPFNPETKIRYDLARNTDVKVVIYDILGKQVGELVNQRQNAGTYEVSFDGSQFASGIYFYKIVTNEFVQVKRMLLVK
ncbi:MAG: T9SS type A sorting domain-containing protein [Ignavibacteriae bacterium]|nr:T9SS type A sorting domain-containing protein [Ignavibacteriota bacterium]